MATLNMQLLMNVLNEAFERDIKLIPDSPLKESLHRQIREIYEDEKIVLTGVCKALQSEIDLFESNKHQTAVSHNKKIIDFLERLRLLRTSSQLHLRAKELKDMQVELEGVLAELPILTKEFYNTLESRFADMMVAIVMRFTRRARAVWVSGRLADIAASTLDPESSLRH